MARAVVKENGLAPAGEGVVACMHTHIYIYTTNTNPSERDGITKEEKVWRKGGQRTEGGWSQPWRQLVTGY